MQQHHEPRAHTLDPYSEKSQVLAAEMRKAIEEMAAESFRQAEVGVGLKPGAMRASAFLEGVLPQV